MTTAEHIAAIKDPDGTKGGHDGFFFDSIVVPPLQDETGLEIWDRIFMPWQEIQPITVNEE